MNNLKDRKTILEVSFKEQESRSEAPKITDGQVKQLILMISGFVTDRNISEYKRFIQYYANKVMVYKGNVELIF